MKRLSPGDAVAPPARSALTDCTSVTLMLHAHKALSLARERIAEAKLHIPADIGSDADGAAFALQHAQHITEALKEAQEAIAALGGWTRAKRSLVA
jgi:hypothetical protein